MTHAKCAESGIVLFAGSPPALPKRPGPGHPLFHYVVSGPHGIALFDYEGSHPDDLSFKVCGGYLTGALCHVLKLETCI